MRRQLALFEVGEAAPTERARLRLGTRVHLPPVDLFCYRDQTTPEWGASMPVIPPDAVGVIGFEKTFCGLKSVRPVVYGKDQELRVTCPSCIRLSQKWPQLLRCIPREARS